MNEILSVQYWFDDWRFILMIIILLIVIGYMAYTVRKDDKYGKTK